MRQQSKAWNAKPTASRSLRRPMPSFAATIETNIPKEFLAKVAGRWPFGTILGAARADAAAADTNEERTHETNAPSPIRAGAPSPA